MKPRLVLLCKSPPQNLTPVLSIALALARRTRVCLVTTDCAPSAREALERAEVEVVTSGGMEGRRFLGRAARAYGFRREACEYIRAQHKDPSEVRLWVGSGDTALALAPELLRTEGFVLQLHELYDTNPVYLRLLGPLARRAMSVVVPESNRADILRCWYRLDHTPFVIPNKPWYHPRKRGLAVSGGEVRAALDSLHGRKIVLYQGDLGPLRDIRQIAKAVNKLGDQWAFVTMGRDQDGFVPEIRAQAPNAIHIPHLTAPTHLEFTSHAHIGVAVYGFDMLNAVFCAPNKIWEYSGFGIPVLCQDLAGLRSTVGAAQAGLCVDTTDPAKVERAIEAIDDRYPVLSANAARFFESVDTEQTALQALRLGTTLEQHGDDRQALKVRE